MINADVNGSYNILRKAIPNAFSDGIESCVVQPRRVNPLEVKAKGEGLNASHGTVIDDYTFTSYKYSTIALKITRTPAPDRKPAPAIPSFPGWPTELIN